MAPASFPRDARLIPRAAAAGAAARPPPRAPFRLVIAIDGLVPPQHPQRRASGVDVPADTLLRMDPDDLVTEQARPKAGRLHTAQRLGPPPQLESPAHARPERARPVGHRVIDHERHPRPRRHVAELPALAHPRPADVDGP